jgi:hypothetical protein
VNTAIHFTYTQYNRGCTGGGGGGLGIGGAKGMGTPDLKEYFYQKRSKKFIKLKNGKII